MASLTLSIALPLRRHVLSSPTASPRLGGYGARCNAVSPSMAIQGRRSGTRGFSRTAVAAEKKYTKDHEWIEVSSDGKIGTIGITTYAAHSLGDVVYVELPSSLPLKVSAGDAIGAVESVKSASDIMSPVSGTVVEANSTLEEKPAEINRAPEGDGWVARVELGAEGKGDLDGLMGEKEYKAFTEE